MFGNRRGVWCFVGPLCVVTAVVAAGCGGGGGGSSASPTAPTGPPPTGLTESFASIQAQVFNTRCITCHGSTRLEQGLNLQSGAYNNLVNRRSTQVPALFLVAPGNPDASYLIHKLEGRSGIVGSRMPDGSSPLSAADIDIIKRWIQSGAANN